MYTHNMYVYSVCTIYIVYVYIYISHRIHGAAIYGNMDPINIPPLC